MKYNEYELKYIAQKRPDLALYKPPTLDQVIVSFLAKYEVYAKPPTSNTNWGDVSNTLLGGPQIGLESMQVSAQKKQTNTQEWNQWKQWALDHKDFEDYKAKTIGKLEEKYRETLAKYEDPKIKKEIEKILQEYNSKALIGLLTIGFIAIIVLVIISTK